MKKIIIAIISLFSFFIFCFLGTIIAASNTFGVTVNNDKLFPSITLTALEDNIIPPEATRYLHKYLENDDTYTIINNSDNDLEFEITTNNSPSYDFEYEFQLYLNSEQYFLLNNNQITISTVPDDYPRYISFGTEYHESDYPSHITLSESEGFEGNYSQQEVDDFYNTIETTTQKITIKKGASYEIKLPE